MILIVAKIPVRPEYADDWPTLMHDFTTATRAESGNVGFDWSRSLHDPNEYVLVEAFVDTAAGVAHVASEHFGAAMVQFAKLISAVPEIVNVEVDGGWARMAEVRPDFSDS